MPTKLSLANLGQIAKTATVPAYDQALLTAGIVHIGTGNFHRAHQAIYLDDLFARGEGHDWAIVGAGVRPNDAAMRETLKSQDYLTTVVEQEADGSKARVTKAMIDFVPVGDHAALIARLADPAIRIVSLTITEGGYFINPATGKFDPANPEIVADGRSPEAPKTAFGLILAGIAKRRAAGTAPFTVMSCDNIPHNGVVCKNAVAGLADLFDKDLAAYVRANIAFPNGMVDRITPATTDRERAILAKDFDIADGWPVFCEGFIQWVLEDTFPSGRPALEKVGVTFVKDVSPFELMKIRILNGGHAAICYPSALLDIHFVHDAMQHPVIGPFLDKLELEEIVPCVPPVPDTNIQDYYRLIVRRFSNPKIADTIPRLAFDGSNRQPKFILPSALDRLKAGKSVTGLSLVSALWCHYCAGISDSGRAIPPNDPIAERLKSAALAAKADPMAFLAMEDIFGEAGKAPAFRTAFSGWLKALQANGTEATLKKYLTT